MQKTAKIMIGLKRLSEAEKFNREAETILKNATSSNYGILQDEQGSNR
jgi:hypothetical protein